ncbi:DoxX family protein [Paenibacillus sp. SI8]|uniref:DoxX family protein n=1 Tax=unclassified Paenibacillus TaxID=185978 RepID=UPI003464F0F8
MAPLIALVASFSFIRLIGLIGWSYFDGWHPSLQAAVAVMFLLTASAHWGKRRPDLIQMVPPSLPQREWIVTATGWLEIAGAIGILIPATSQAASICLALLLLAMFPANIRAAREKLTIGGKPVSKLLVRTLLQLIFLAAVLFASPDLFSLLGV